MSVIKLFAITFLSFLFINFIAYGQTFSIESLEGTQEEVVICKNENGGRTFMVASNCDTLYVPNEYSGEITVSLLNKNFAAVTYDLPTFRGEITSQCLLLICIQNKKVYAALHIPSKRIYARRHTEPTPVYEVIGSVSEKRKKPNYRMKLSIRDTHWDDVSGVQKHIRKTIRLKFSEQDKVFFNAVPHFDTLDLYYNRYNAADYYNGYLHQLDFPIKMTGYGFPAIKLGDKTYYFCYDRWFESSAEGYFFCTTSKTWFR